MKQGEFRLNFEGCYLNKNNAISCRCAFIQQALRSMLQKNIFYLKKCIQKQRVFIVNKNENMQSKYQVGSETFNVYTRDDLFILQEVYTRLIGEVSCVSKISFYRNHKQDSKYIRIVYFTDICETIDTKYVYRNRVTCITQKGLALFISKNKKKILNKLPRMFDEFIDNYDDIIYDDYHPINCDRIIFQKQNNSNSKLILEEQDKTSCQQCNTSIDRVYSIQEFQQQYYHDMIDQKNFKNESYKNVNCLIQCNSCIEKFCMFCIINQLNKIICRCKQEIDIQIDNESSNISINLNQVVVLNMAVLQLINKTTSSILFVQRDAFTQYRLLYQYDIFTKLLYYDNLMESPEYSHYSMYISENKDLNIRYQNQFINYIDEYSNLQFLGPNKFRKQSYKTVYTYDGQFICKIERYIHNLCWKQSELEIPTLSQLDQLLNDNPQSALAYNQSVKKFNHIHNCMEKSDFTSNQPFMIFIQESSCYCGGSIPIKAYYIYNKERKTFNAHDIALNLKKQGLRCLCNHNFLESIRPVAIRGDYVYELHFGS